jgi:two-component system, NarL family, nitrate/nitrite response regulator NarL
MKRTSKRAHSSVNRAARTTESLLPTKPQAQAKTLLDPPDPILQIRIVIADDHPIFRAGLRDVLRTQVDFCVVGEADGGDEAVRLVHQLNPDILLLDFSMPGSSGVDVLRRLRQRSDVQTILLTAGVNQSETAHALQAGARGVVLKGSPTAFLFKSIRGVVDGQLWLRPEELAGVISALAGRDRERLQPSLTRREHDVLERVASGESNNDVARSLSISEDTVKHHMTNIFDKTGVSTRVELALYAIRNGLVNDRSTLEADVPLPGEAQRSEPGLHPRQQNR